MRRGPLLMVLAGAMFTLMVGIVKASRSELSALEVMWWRAAVSVPLGYLLARRAGLHLTNLRLFVVRAGLGFCAMFCFFQAAKGLELANLSFISKLHPILVAILAPWALGASERVGRRTWLVLALGFAGCLLLLGPDLRAGSLFGLWALAATILSAGAHLAVRKLGATEHPATLVFWFQLTVLGASELLLFSSESKLLPGAPPGLVPWLLLCGAAGTAGQMLMTWAYKLDHAAIVAAASYASPLWALLGGILVFHEIPGPHLFAGGSLVVVSGLLLLFGRNLLKPPLPAPPLGPGEE